MAPNLHLGRLPAHGKPSLSARGGPDLPGQGHTRDQDGVNRQRKTLIATANSSIMLLPDSHKETRGSSDHGLVLNTVVCGNPAT